VLDGSDPLQTYPALPFRFAHRRFCARLIFRRAAADIFRRLRGRVSIIAAGSAELSIEVPRLREVPRLGVDKCGKLLTSAATSVDTQIRQLIDTSKPAIN
jgi:hypothetical protein